MPSRSLETGAVSTAASFWEFSVRVYGMPGVQAACLALQNERGLDVNLLLYCCWLGAGGSRLRATELDQVLEFTEPWARNVVRPLRSVRSSMKHDHDARGRLPANVYEELRESVKAIELEAERMQQLALEAMAPQRDAGCTDPGERAAGAVDNLRLYLSAAHVTVDTDVCEHLATLVSAASGTEHERAAEQLAKNCTQRVEIADD